MLCGPSFGQCYAGSNQERWLVADLKAHSNQCTMAAWHHPLYSASEREIAMQPMWNDLYDYGADLVLTGHVHRYERWAPQNKGGGRDDTFGIREFVVGSGGRNFHSLNSFPANMEAGNDNTFGVLRLGLHATSYDWQFLPIAGSSFTDSGSTNCHGKPGGASTDVLLAAAPAGGSGAMTQVLGGSVGGSVLFTGAFILAGALGSRSRLKGRRSGGWRSRSGIRFRRPVMTRD
jgi:hypothetical protein